MGVEMLLLKNCKKTITKHQTKTKEAKFNNVSYKPFIEKCKCTYENIFSVKKIQ